MLPSKSFPDVMKKFGFIQGNSSILASTREDDQKHLDQLSHTLEDLEELGDIMGEMLQTQESVEVYFSAETSFSWFC
jgi:autophagy-related protein 17